MAYLNDEDDEALMLALKASMEEQEQEQDLANPARKNSAETRELEGLKPSDDDDSESDDEEETLDDEELPNDNDNTTTNTTGTTDTTDDDITKALETSLLEFDYKNNEDDILNFAMKASLNTIEEDRKRKLKHQSEEDEILSKVIEESYASNVAAQFNSGLVIGGSINQNSEYNYDYEDEAEYMKVVLQQIKESEEKEAKLKQTKNKRSIIQEQDFEYEEALKQDIAKEKAKTKETSQPKENVKTKETKMKSPKNTKPRQSKKTNNNTIENIINSIEEKDDTDEAEDEQLKTVDDIRKARLAFFERK
jgi:hypothetical protein